VITIFDEPELVSHKVAHAAWEKVVAARDKADDDATHYAKRLADELVYHRRTYPRRKFDLSDRYVTRLLGGFEEAGELRDRSQRQVQHAHEVSQVALRRHHPAVWERHYGTSAVAR